LQSGDLIDFITSDGRQFTFSLGVEYHPGTVFEIKPREEEQHDPVNHPKHYTSHPSGIECIEITRWFNFNLGNVIKYIWRAPLKDLELEDLKKARWYLDDEIKTREKING
jgi:hypothetical protein